MSLVLTGLRQCLNRDVVDHEDISDAISAEWYNAKVTVIEVFHAETKQPVRIIHQGWRFDIPMLLEYGVLHVARNLFMSCEVYSFQDLVALYRSKRRGIPLDKAKAIVVQEELEGRNGIKYC